MTRRPHRLEIYPMAGRMVHRGAFCRAIETIANFDNISMTDATDRALAMLDTSEIRLKVEQGHAAYVMARRP